MTPLLKTSGWAVWASGKTDSSSTARSFAFTGDGKYYWFKRDDSGIKRAFAVRSLDKSKPAAKTDKRFDVQDDVVIDHKTGLHWQRNHQWGNYTEAREKCDAISPSGNWRLPTQPELLNLLSPKADKAAFPDTTNVWYWTTSPANEGEMSVVGGEKANTGTYSVNKGAGVRCVSDR
jgi:hypothetical protein